MISTLRALFKTIFRRSIAAKSPLIGSHVAGRRAVAVHVLIASRIRGGMS